MERYERIPAVLVVCMILSPFVRAQYGGGSGTADDPYLIYTPQQMNAVGADPNDWDKHFKLMADIDLGCYTGDDFKILGCWTPFRGVFDGNGKTIRNLTYRGGHGWTRVGLFGFLEYAEVKDLILVDPNVGCGDQSYVGALAGYTSGSKITRCAVRGGHVRGDSDVGGFVGHNMGDIRECTSSAEVVGDAAVGGLVGYFHYGVVANSYSSGSVHGRTGIGGLAGYCSYQAAVGHSYSTCLVLGETDVGGLVGLSHGAEIWYSLWDIDASGQSVGTWGVGKTSGEMMLAATYAGWGADGAWTIQEGVDYPHLAWENMLGEPFATPATPLPLAGSGTAKDPYVIYTAEDLNVIGLFPDAWDKCYKLMADIDMSGIGEFNVIGRYFRYPSYGTHPFTGVFDGNGKKIIGCHYLPRDPWTAPTLPGIFWSIEGGEVRDLEMVNPNIDGAGNGVGLLVGSISQGARIVRCKISGGSVSGGRTVGGLVSYSYEGTIDDCEVRCSVSGQSEVGGIVGKNRGTIVDCRFEGQVMGVVSQIGGLAGINDGTMDDCTVVVDIVGGPKCGEPAPVTRSPVRGQAAQLAATEVGGLAGANRGIISRCTTAGRVLGWTYVGGLLGGNNNTVTQCFSTADVCGKQYVGGLAGQNGLNRTDVVWSGRIQDSYATGNIAGTSDVGGLVGYNDHHGTISNSYSIGQVSGTSRTGGLVGENNGGGVIESFWDIETSGRTVSAAGTGKTTEQMKTRSTFALWDGHPAWALDEGNDYPRLLWEKTGGEPLAKPRYGGGEGTSDDPYLIYTPEQLNEIGLRDEDLDKHFRLMADVDLSAYTGTSFRVIGSSYTRPFYGTFDGLGHTISHFTFRYDPGSDIGLFGNLGRSGRIENLKLVDAQVTAATYVGALVGYSKGTIQNCSVTGTVQAKNPAGYVGGIVGISMDGGLISDCRADVSISGGYETGAIAGANSRSTIVRCLATGRIEGTDCVGGITGRQDQGSTLDCSCSCTVISLGRFCGGLVGRNYLRSTVTRCFATGDVCGAVDAGGLVGYNDSEIHDCWVAANVSGNEVVGGFVGEMVGGSVSHSYSRSVVAGRVRKGGFVGQHMGKYSCTGCFWDRDIDLLPPAVGDTPGISSKPSAELRTSRTFIEAGWDFVDETQNGVEDIWSIDEGVGYPRLTWELLPSGSATEAP